MTSKGVVQFNVGGIRYEVAQSLLDACPDSMLARIASKEWEQNEKSEIFIERDGTRFKYCLDVLRDGKVSLPLTVSKSAILEDLIYYGIDVNSSSVSYDEISVTNMNGLFLNRMHISERDLKKLIVHEKKLLEEIERVETELAVLKERGDDANDRIRVFHGARIIYERIISDMIKCVQSPTTIKVKADPKIEGGCLTFLAKNNEKHFDDLKDILGATFGIELISLTTECPGPSSFTFGTAGPFGGGSRNSTFPSNANFAANSVATTIRQDSTSTSTQYLVVEFIVTTGPINNQ